MTSKIVQRVVLASGSEFRQKLLRDAGVPFVVSVPDFDETTIVAANASEQARARATGKAWAAARGQLNSITIGADQTLGVGDAVLGKAKDREDAGRQLRLLSGRTHHLYSAYTLVYSGRVVEEPRVVVERVVDLPMTMRALSDVAIERYLDTGEWQGCAGCYRVEGAGIRLMDSIAPSHTGIMGLPMVELLRDLRAVGVDLLERPEGPWGGLFG